MRSGAQPVWVTIGINRGRLAMLSRVSSISRDIHEISIE